MNASPTPPLADEEQPDDALMRAVGRGDRAAFAGLVARHADRPYRVAWRMLGDAAEAQDVAQDALLKLWTEAPRWQSRGLSVGGWLARVATNACLDRLRRRGRLSDEPVPERADPAPLADAALAAEDDASAVRAALDSLPDRQRAAVVLTYYEDLSNAAAADLLDMNIKAFESLLLRARRALRVALAELRDA